MSYTKHNFRSGNKLYAAQLNEMDDQVAANEEAIDRGFFPAMSDATIYESAKNPFAWEAFDKGYVSFVFDDLRDSVDSPCSIFEEYGFPIVLAAIPARENAVANGLSQTRGNFTPGMTMKSICLQVVANGGEIMAHNPRAINTELQWDKDFMYEYFIGTKKKLESWGLNIRGIIRAGGEDQLSFSPEIDRWLISNYEYSNMSENFANHNIQRITINQSIENLKTAIGNAAENKSWVRIMAHDYDYGGGETFTGESDLREILDYCKTSGISVVTYSYMFDRFGTSELASNRDISLTPIIADEVVNDQYYNAITGEHYTGSASGCWYKYSVVPGKKYYVTGSAPYSGAAYPCCAFFNDGDTYRLAAYGTEAYATLEDYEVEAPANADYMVLNTTNRFAAPPRAKIEVNLAGKVSVLEEALNTTISDLDDLRDDVEQLSIDRNTARVLLAHTTKVEGSLRSCIDGSTAGTNRQGWEYRLYDVTPGRAYYVSGRAASTGAIYPCCAFFAEGSDYRLAAYGVEADTAYDSLRVVAPSNSVKMLVNTSSVDLQPIVVRAELDLGEQVVNLNNAIANLTARIEALEA